MAKRKSVNEVIRQVIERRKLTQYRIAKDTGVSQGTMSRFLRSQQILGGETIDVLCEYLDLELVERKKKK